VAGGQEAKHEESLAGAGILGRQYRNVLGHEYIRDYANRVSPWAGSELGSDEQYDILVLRGAPGGLYGADEDAISHEEEDRYHVVFRGDCVHALCDEEPQDVLELGLGGGHTTLLLMRGPSGISPYPRQSRWG
jgi:hypothetical protein